MKRILLGVGIVGILFFFIGHLSYRILGPSTGSEQQVTYRVTEQPPDNWSRKADPTPSKSVKKNNQVSRDTTPKSDDQAPRVAIVIDDLGWEMKTAPVYDRIHVPLTMAVLPERPHSHELYNRWKSRFEFIIHMPMEPAGYPEDDPGKLALLTSMGDTEISQRLRRAFQLYPRAVGLNNHMGSAFTARSDLMSVVMKNLSERDMYYFDSGTTPGETALEQAEQWGVNALKNQVFLDHERDDAFVRNQLEHLVEIAREHGSAVAIGHIQSVETARVLYKQIPRYREKGVRFVPLSDLVGVPRLRARR